MYARTKRDSIMFSDVVVQSETALKKHKEDRITVIRYIITDI